MIIAAQSRGAKASGKWVFALGPGSFSFLVIVLVLHFPSRTTSEGFGAPPLRSRLIAKAATALIGCCVLNVTRDSPVAASMAIVPALTGTLGLASSIAQS